MSAVLASRSRGLSGERKFYTGMALLSAAIVLVGFGPTFFFRPATQQPLQPLLIVHGLVFTGWMVTLVTQAFLVAADRRDLHRKLGILGACIAIAMTVLGTMAAVNSLKLGRAPIEGLDPRTFFVIPMRAIFGFAVLAGCAIALRRDLATHKRLIILATIAILDAAIARLPGLIAFGPLGFFALQDLMIAGACFYDWRAHGRVHRAYLWGGALIVLTQPLALAISGARPWLAFADWVLAVTR